MFSFKAFLAPFDFLLEALGSSVTTATWHEIEDKEAMYKVYADTYLQAGKKPWSYHDFEWRAENWIFIGVLPPADPTKIGMVTAREENGVLKLTGMMGSNNRAKIAGMIELNKTGKPIWGAMDKDFVEHLKKLGFTSPPASAMKLFYPIIKSDNQFHSGGTWENINPDGSINFNLQGVGQTTKFFTGNKSFFRILINKVLAKTGGNQLTSFLQKWNSVPPSMKPHLLMMAKTMSPSLGNIDAETVDWIAGILDETPATAKPVASALTMT